MRTQICLACSLAVTMAFEASATAAAEPKPAITIDDFSTGPLHQVMPAIATGWGTSYQAGTVLGGVRQTNLSSDDTLGGSSRIDIGDNRMLVSSSIGSYFGAFAAYGYDAYGNDGGMSESFAGYDYFQIDFEVSDVGLAYYVEVWDVHGTGALLSGVLTTEAQSGVFPAQLRLTEFVGGDSSGNPTAIDWAHIHYVLVMFQSGSAVGGNDFSVAKISVVDEPDPE